MGHAYAVITLVALALVLGVPHIAFAQTTHNLVTLAVWEDATPDTIVKARNCLPLVLQNLYIPALMAATENSLNKSITRIASEQLILFHFYQRLSGAWEMCKAFGQALRMGQHYIENYEGQYLTTPALFPRQSLMNATATCNAAVNKAATNLGDQSVRDLFRHHYTDGTICLRAYTIHGGVAT